MPFYWYIPEVKNPVSAVSWVPCLWSSTTVVTALLTTCKQF
jgi:hypothetical protein